MYFFDKAAPDAPRVDIIMISANDVAHFNLLSVLIENNRLIHVITVGLLKVGHNNSIERDIICLLYTT